MGLGGVGSWAAEALARSGVARLVLIDLDHVAESNIQRQVQAVGRTLGQHKGLALRERIADIHPGCVVQVVDEFVTRENWPGLLDGPVQVLIDACDQVRAKAALAAWSLQSGTPLICVGAAGGKQRPQDVEVADLSQATHDPLLASLRQRLRKHAPRLRSGLMHLCCVFSREPVQEPLASPDIPEDDPACATDGSLNCHGYGSSVTVTATFGMVAAAEATRCLLASDA